jgi:hypothetical protein
MKSLKKFSKFESNNKDIFLHYNKNFKLPICYKFKKRCKCFVLKSNVDFSFEYPLSYIQIIKKRIRKVLDSFEKHNNLSNINYNENANLLNNKIVKTSIIEHKKSLEVFEKYFLHDQNNKFLCKYSNYYFYIESQKSECDNFSKNMSSYVNNCKVPFVMFNVSLYSHYHTLKLFENFVNKS